MNNKLIMFTKPWKNETLEDLARLVKKLGLDGIELPVRDGYQVTPSNVTERLPEAVDIFGKYGLVIGSVAGSIDKDTIEAMGKAGISILRVCLNIDMSRGYFDSVKDHQRLILEHQDELEANKVKVGIQNHNGYCVASALGLHHILSGIPDNIAGAVLDFAHCGVAGEPVDMAYDIVKDSLMMVNFKSCYQARLTGPDEEEAKWQVLWSTSRNSIYSWKDAINLLSANDYKGYICLPAEYNHLGVKEPIMDNEAAKRVLYDIQYLKSLMEVAK